MKITKEAIQQRITELRDEEQMLLAKLNAIAGAVQDCEAWAAFIDTPEPKGSSKEA